MMTMLPNAENFDLQDVVVTEWTIGATPVAGWGQVCILTPFYLSSLFPSQLPRLLSVANHGGGYSYRLCKLGPGEPPSLMINIIRVKILMPVIK